MINPGKFIEWSDFDQRFVEHGGGQGGAILHISKEEQIIMRFYFGAESKSQPVSYNWRQRLPTGYNNWRRRMQRNITYQQQMMVELDTMDYYVFDEYTDLATPTDLEARLGCWAAWSPKTIAALHYYYHTCGMRQREFGRWVNARSIIKYVWDKHFDGFVPSKLRAYYWNTQFSRRYLVYCWHHMQNLQNYISDIVACNTNPYNSTAQSTALLNYNARATDYLGFIRHEKDRSDIFYGLELEYENSNTVAIQTIREKYNNFLILKRDGSLNNGLEMCTAPAHFAVHQEKFKEFFQMYHTTLLTTDDRTGFHVHISREPLSFLQLGKLFAFMNNSHNEELLINIAGRESNSYCRPTHASYLKSYPFTNWSGPDRYRRVNLTNNATVEFRMFSTPVTYEDFMYKMEFCKSVVDYTAPGEVSLATAEHQDPYLTYVYHNKQHYPHLWKHLLTHGV